MPCLSTPARPYRIRPSPTGASSLVPLPGGVPLLRPPFYLHTHAAPSLFTYLRTRSMQPRKDPCYASSPPTDPRRLQPFYLPTHPFSATQVGPEPCLPSTTATLLPRLVLAPRGHATPPLPGTSMPVRNSTTTSLLPRLSSACGPSGGLSRAPATPVHTQSHSCMLDYLFLLLFSTPSLS